MKEEELIKTLKQIRPQAKTSWKESTLNHLMNLNSNVTDSKNARTSIHRLFYFLSPMKMNTKVKVSIGVLTVLVVLGSSVGIVSAAGASNPGDLLYPINRAVEKVQESFTTDPVAKVKLQMSLFEKRLKELNSVSKNNDPRVVKAAITEVKLQEKNLKEELANLTSKSSTLTDTEKSLLAGLNTQFQNDEVLINQILTNLLVSGDTENSNSVKQVQEDVSHELTSSSESSSETSVGDSSSTKELNRKSEGKESAENSNEGYGSNSSSFSRTSKGEKEFNDGKSEVENEHEGSKISSLSSSTSSITSSASTSSTSSTIIPLSAKEMGAR
ncbi:MAG: DUF5667 domain-containing protein [bacterium]